MGRELTKIYEEILRGTAIEILEKLRERDSIKGEIVFSIYSPGAESESTQIDDRKLVNLLTILQKGGKKVDQKTFIELAKALGWKRNKAYDLSLRLQEDGLLGNQ